MEPVTPSPGHPATSSTHRALVWSKRHLLTHGSGYLSLLVALAFMAIYARTAAPSVLSGDSAEFQLAAATLGVAHPTTYPLYTLLGHLATLVLPFGDLARRVTLLTAGCAAAAVGLFCFLALRLGLSRRAALLGAIALGVTPGLWNAATAAEVYALLALLMVGLGVQLSAINYRLSAIGYALAALIAGLGFTHHGLFAIAALPPFAIWAVVRLAPLRGATLIRRMAALLLGFLAGCSPWLYPLIQFARFGPFAGIDYGLPRHYYWGAPTNWTEVFDLLTGGTVRRGIFRIPTSSDTLATLNMLWGRANFEFGAIGLVLALVGCMALAWQLRRAWLVSIWVLLATSGYLLLLGPAVEDAPIFTLPMLLPLALWLAYGAHTLMIGSQWLMQRVGLQGRSAARVASWLVFVALLGLSISWADTRVEHASKRQLTLYRTFGEAVLSELPPNAVLIAHWEQGMVFQYLRLVEQQRPDVWVDVVEPSDDAWGPRIERRYPDRPVFLIGQAPDVEGLPVELMREDPYALVFRLRK